MALPTGYGIDPDIGYTEPAINTYYLDAVNGDDTTGTGTTGLPWQTIAKILTVMDSGDTIILRTGNYGALSQNDPTSRTDWITFKADTGHTPVITNLSLNNTTLKDVYLRFDGIDFSFTTEVGLYLSYVKYFEVRNGELSNPNHKYQSDKIIQILDSESVLVYHNHAHTATRFLSSQDTINVTISKNHVHGLGGGSFAQYAGGCLNWIIEKNNAYDSNYVFTPEDPNSPYTEGNPGGWPHSSAVSVRANDLWIRGNIFHDIGSSAGIMFYIPDVLGGEDPYNNIILENNLLYDIQNTLVLRMYNMGSDIVVKNNTLIGSVRTDTSDGRYKMYTGLTVHSLGLGADGSGLSVINNIIAGTVNLPDLATTENNIFWSHTFMSATSTFVETSNDVDTKVLTWTSDYPISYLTTTYFIGVDAEADFAFNHQQTLDFHLNSLSEAVNFGDTTTQSGISLGDIDVDGFIDGSPVRDATHHSAGSYEFITGDVTAPILSNPTGTATGDTIATGTVTTDEIGTLYYIPTINVTELEATIKAGSFQAASTGVQNVTLTGLSPATTYYLHYIEDDATTNTSNIVSSASFTTEANTMASLFDPTHEVVINATSLVSMDVIGASGEPYDDSTESYWSPVTTNGTTAYAKETINSVTQLARQDIDEDGIAYQAPITGLDPDTTAFWFMMSYNVLAAPSASTKALFQVGEAIRDSSPVINITSEDTTNLRSWCASGWRFATTPINVGTQHFVIYKYDGVSEHDYYDSQYGSWRTLSAAHSAGGVTSGFWLGTGYNAELPASYEYFVGAFGYAPSMTIMESLVADPYQIFLSDASTGGSVGDNLLRATGAGSINDGLRTWFGASQGQVVNDAERAWLLAKPATSSGCIQDLWKQFLVGEGYTGSLNDMMLQYWRAQ